MIKVSYLEQQDVTLECYTEWEWHCVKVILEQRLRSWLQIIVNIPVNNKATVSTLYFRLCVPRRIDTWQIVYLLYEDACPIIAIHIN